MKKILSVSLVLALILGAVCIFPASAEEQPKGIQSGDFYYRVLDDGTAEITDYNRDKKGDVEIPSEIDGYTVTRIGESAFEHNQNVYGVSIPDTVVYIADHAFDFCSSMGWLELPDSVTYIGERAFALCFPLSGVGVLPANLKYLADHAFLECWDLDIKKLPDGLEHIGDAVFFGCYDMKISEIPDSVKYIGDNVFTYGTVDANLKLPETLEYLGHHAFSFLSYEIEENGLSYLDGYLIMANEYKTGKVNVDYGTKAIAARTFQNCNQVTSVTIPDTVKSMGEACFYNCSNLKRVSLASGITQIYPETFAGCKSLEYVFIPESISTIDESAFYINQNLIIAGYKDTEAEKFAYEHNIRFKDVNEYKNRVLELLQITEENNSESENQMAFYREEYEHYSNPSENEATPDYVLIKAHTDTISDAFAAERFGDYILRTNGIYYPATFGYHIYLPKTNEVYSLEEAYKLGIKNIEKVFTEGIAGELLGDVNYDNKLNVKDATLIQKAVAGISEIENNEIEGFMYNEEENVPYYIADFNCDGKMNIRDATAIQKRLAKMDNVSLEHKVVGIYSVAPTYYDNYPEAKAVAKTKAELESVLSRLPCETAEAKIDATFDEAYFKEHNVIVISDFVGSSCCKYLVNKLEVNGSSLTVNTISNSHGECVPDVYCQCTLIEVDKEPTNNIANIDIADTKVIICYDTPNS